MNAEETWLGRRILQIPWTDRVTNETVLQWAGVERELLKTMSKRQMSFLGHVYRKGNLKRAPLKQEGSGKTKTHISLKPVQLILVESNQNVRLGQKTGKRETPMSALGWNKRKPCCFF